MQININKTIDKYTLKPGDAFWAYDNDTNYIRFVAFNPDQRLDKHYFVLDTNFRITHSYETMEELIKNHNIAYVIKHEDLVLSNKNNIVVY